MEILVYLEFLEMVAVRVCTAVQKHADVLQAVCVKMEVTDKSLHVTVV